MDIVMTTIVGSLASATFNGAKDYLLQSLGRSSPTSKTPLLEKYLEDLQHVREDLQHLKERGDEDRIAKLLGGLSLLKEASRSNVAKQILGGAYTNFHDISKLPQEGVTGKYKNAELRSMAFIGMAATHLLLLEEKKEIIAEKMVEAVVADAATAKQWLGEELVTAITSQMEVTCPICGHRNPQTSRFCNQDGYSLIPSVADKGSSWRPIRELLKEPQFSEFAFLEKHYKTVLIGGLVEVLAPARGVSQVRKDWKFSCNFANVALALFTAEADKKIYSQIYGHFVTLCDIPHGFMLEAVVEEYKWDVPGSKLPQPEYKWFDPRSILPQGAASLFYFVEEESPLNTLVTMIFRGGMFNFGEKYLDQIVSRMDEQLNPEQA